MTINEIKEKINEISETKTLSNELNKKYSQIKKRQEELEELNLEFLTLTNKIKNNLETIEIECNKEFQKISKKNNKIVISNKWQKVAKECLVDIDGSGGIGSIGAALAEKYSNGVSCLKALYPEILEKFLAIHDWDSLQDFHTFCQDYGLKKTLENTLSMGESAVFPEQWFDCRRKFNDNWYKHPIVLKEYEKEEKYIQETMDEDYLDDYND